MPQSSSRYAALIVLFGFMSIGGAATAFPVGPDLPDNTADWLRAFVGYQYTYDDNLFRLPSPSNYPNPPIQPGASQVDHINTAVAGLDGNWIAGRQSVNYDFEVDNNRFIRNSDLNNTSGTGRAVWNWSVESNLTGTLGADYTRTLAGFADSFFFQRDLVDRAEYFGSGRFQIGPRWAVYGSLSDADTTNSAAVVRFNNFDTQTAKGGVEFATSLQNTVGWEYRYARGHYPDPDFFLNGTKYDPDYRENSSVFLGKYLFSERTVLSGDVGYLRRDYPSAPVGAFSGEIWHAKFQWQPTPKTSLLVTAGRDLQAYLYAQSDYFVQDGISVAPTWVESDKLTWTASVSWYRQNYILSNVSVLIPSQLLLVARHDNLSAQQINLAYTPYRWLLLNILYHHEVRSSNQPLLGYDDDIVQAGVKIRF
jgi:hypothetical protein